VADNFRDLLLMHGLSAPYQVRVQAADGAERSVDLEGVTREGIAQRFRSNLGQVGNAKGPAYHGFTYRVLEPGIGYVNLRTLGGDLQQFQKDAAAMFKQVAVDHNSKLIIDLRQNGGGDSRLADELLRHFTTTPYRMYSRKDWKMSAEYRAYLKTFIASPIRWLPLEHLSSQGRELFDGPNGKMVIQEEKLTTPKRAEPYFTGKVYLLIGPRTFSSASDLADAAKTYHLATLVGDETGGRPNTFGEGYQFLLPHSGFVTQVSLAYFLRASGDAADHRGVIPDILVRPAREDLRTGKDVVLERAKGAQ
jgi:C-terminal processing protease CtpA/Prc